MKISRMLIMSMCILLVCLPQICAIIDIKIDMKPEFFTGDVIAFNYTIDSESSQTIRYMESVDCPNAPHAMLDPKSAFVNLVVRIHGKYNYLKVTEDIMPQECTAYVAILEPIEKVVSKTFTINTTPPFDFNIILNKKVFVRGEEIDIDYKSEVKDPLIEATLIYPWNFTEQIDLPYSFKADKIGTYGLEVNASKEGYKTVSLNEQFGIIKENADIEYTSLAEGFAIKQDPGWFSRAQEDPVGRVVKYTLYFLFGVIILLIIFEIFKKIFSKVRQSIYFSHLYSKNYTKKKV